MNDLATKPAAVKAGSVVEQMALLHMLVFAALRMCRTQFDDFTSRLANRLTTLADEVNNPDEVSVYRDASQRLERHRTTFHRLFDDSLQQSLLQAVQEAAEHGHARMHRGAMDLSINTFEAMERKVLLDNLSQALDATDPDVLATLGLRIEHSLQAEAFGVALNPFRSEVFLKAAADAWQKFDSNADAKDLALRQMQADVFLQLGPVWHELNQELVARNVLPDAEQIHRRRTMEPAMPPAPTMKHRLQQWLAPIGTMNVIDVRAVTLLDKTIEKMASQNLLGPDVTAMLVSLQAPLREVARTDNEFFFNARHPARRLSEVLLAAGLACDGEPEEPLPQALQHAAQRVRDGDAFDDITLYLEAAIAQQEKRSNEGLGAAIAEALAQENMSHALRVAEDEVLERVESGTVPGIVEEFLQSQWTRVIVLAYGLRNDKPEGLAKVLKTMDDLVWSVQPKIGANERKGLLSALPPMLSLLNSWLNVLKWDGEERQAFFAALAEHHAASMRAADEPTPRELLEARMNAVQKASEYQLAKRARQQQKEAQAEFMQQVEHLAPGCWLEFVRNDGSRMNCQLAWISPGRTRSLFTGRQGQLTFVLTEDALAQALRAQRTRILATGALIDQALAAALDDLT
jgi:hypothetical protein